MSSSSRAKGHIVLIVCREPFGSCIGADTVTFTKAGALALVPEDTDINRRIDQFKTMLGDGVYKQDKFDQYRTTYDACFAYCWAAWKGNTNNGKTFSDTFANASWTNAMGTTRFDGGYSLMQTYSVVKSPVIDENASEFTDADSDAEDLRELHVPHDDSEHHDSRILDQRCEYDS
ncbi:hypothetical protein PRIPAC_75102 [Pristionchus pacificus]|nr:hypothetical protein PRIPAC_75102 [Pristionchus pacificus]